MPARRRVDNRRASYSRQPCVLNRRGGTGWRR